MVFHHLCPLSGPGKALGHVGRVIATTFENLEPLGTKQVRSLDSSQGPYGNAMPSWPSVGFSRANFECFRAISSHFHRFFAGFPLGPNAFALFVC